MTGESEPTSETHQPSIEEQVLVRLGYGHVLDTPINLDLPDSTASPVLGRNFLDAYGDSPQRQHTEDLLRGFADMDSSHPLYDSARSHINRYMVAIFGPAQAE